MEGGTRRRGERERLREIKKEESSYYKLYSRS
jgi:hypothetical protein